MNSRVSLVQAIPVYEDYATPNNLSSVELKYYPEHQKYIKDLQNVFTKLHFDFSRREYSCCSGRYSITVEGPWKQLCNLYALFAK